MSPKNEGYMLINLMGETLMSIYWTTNYQIVHSKHLIILSIITQQSWKN